MFVAGDHLAAVRAVVPALLDRAPERRTDTYIVPRLAGAVAGATLAAACAHGVKIRGGKRAVELKHRSQRTPAGAEYWTKTVRGRRGF